MSETPHDKTNTKAPMRDKNGKEIAVGQRACDCEICGGNGVAGDDGETCPCVIAGCQGYHRWNPVTNGGREFGQSIKPSNALDRVDDLERVVRWVPVGVEFPPEGQKVLWLGRHADMAPFIDVGRRVGRVVVNDNWHRDIGVIEFTHWMELPAPPAEKK